MRVKSILPEDFINYKLPSMFIATCFCDYKCCLEQNLDQSICQNSSLAQSETRHIDDEVILHQFQTNPITKVVVLGGLEPFLQFEEVLNLIKLFRNQGENCPFVIYTGYYPPEIENQLQRLKHYSNIIVKFGRYIPNRPNHLDPILGVTLASDNQYAEVIS